MDMMIARVLTLPALVLLVFAGCRTTPESFIDVTTLEELPPDPYVYTVNPGDVVQVEIAEDADYNWETTVLPDGSATFRWVGELMVMGKTLAEIREELRKELREFYTAPTMTLYLKRVQGPDPIVYLGSFGGGGEWGQRSSGGVVPYRRGIGVIETIARAGGTAEPNVNIMPYIYVVRNIRSIHDRQVYRYDLAKAVRGEAPDLPLHPGDVVFLDQSWLQDLERALTIAFRIVGGAAQAGASYLLFDAIVDKVAD
jgi:protein involved in polysaccharide export with SLBB domain